MSGFLLGLDIGSSSVKASVVDVKSGRPVVTSQSPAEEMGMMAAKPGWAEQEPDTWWQHTCTAIAKCLEHPGVNSHHVLAIGISYQMHGLVVVNKHLKPLRPAIIWCDSRAVAIGARANSALGAGYCLDHFLNSPGNFTASKLRWVKENEPDIFEQIHKVMLPGDYIAMKLSREISTTPSGLSEGILWDYKRKQLANDVLQYFEIDPRLIADTVPVFGPQGKLSREVASTLGLPSGIPVTYRAGDQPNNALSLNVLKPGETAAVAGTSGVIYAVTDQNAFDALSRVNTFVHVNNNDSRISNGVLLCINGTGILNSWLRKNLNTGSSSYEQMNALAASVAIGAEGITILPFGNGAERILQNKTIQSTMSGLDFNRHTQAHVLRAAQEGIVFALRYGFDVLKSIGLHTQVIRAGYANMFLSPLFREAFTNTIGAPLQLYNTDGATGAAIGAGIGAGLFDFSDAFKGLAILEEVEPDDEKAQQYNEAYARWKNLLQQYL
jgi:xylulokinase